MTTTVWVDGWQQDCCGDRFSVGDSVRWSVVEAYPQLAAYFPPSGGISITYAEEHHGRAHNDDVVTIEGRVTAILAVRLSYVEDVPGSRSFRPVPGSARLTALAASDDPARRGAGFTGYLVDLRLERD